MEKIPDPKELEKELSDYLSKKYGGRIKVLAPQLITKPDKDDEGKGKPDLLGKIVIRRGTVNIFNREFSLLTAEMLEQALQRIALALLVRLLLMRPDGHEGRDAPGGGSHGLPAAAEPGAEGAARRLPHTISMAEIATDRRYRHSGRSA